MASGKRYVVFGMLTDSNEWQEAAQYATLKGAVDYVRNNLIGVKGVKTARVHDTEGEIVDREFNCIPVKKAAA